MTEKQSIRGKEIWLRVDSYPVERNNPNIIPKEYFTASYYLQEPAQDANGEVIKDEDGEVKLFESPVAALSFARKRLESII
ncbi:MAG: hypothetical protein ACJ749_11220 [Flavisolibacter sp.]